MPPGGRIFWYLPLPYIVEAHKDREVWGAETSPCTGKQTEGMQEAWRHPARERVLTAPALEEQG